MESKPVIVLALSTCSYCNAIKKMLKDNSIPFDCTDFDLLPPEDRDKEITKLKEINPRVTFPIVIIGNKAIVGLQEETIKKELGIA